jgi:hypothetical protein
MSTHPVIPCATRDPATPTGGELAFEVDMAQIRRMTAKELCDLQDAFNTASEVVAGLASQPRFSTDQNTYNPAGEVIETLCEVLGSYRSAIVNGAKSISTDNAREEKWRWWTQLQYEASMTDGLDDFAVKAVLAVKDMNTVAHREAHRRAGGAA